MKAKLTWKLQKDGAEILFIGKAMVGEVTVSSWARKKFVARCRLPDPAYLLDDRWTHASAKRTVERAALKWFKLAGIDCRVEYNG